MKKEGDPMGLISFRTTDIVNLFMVDTLVAFFDHVATKGNRNLPDELERHDHYELYYIKKGFLTLKLDDGQITLRADPPPRMRSTIT